MWIADSLSQKRLHGMEFGNWKALRRLWSHCISQVVEANAMYSASVDNLEGVGCFLARHEIREGPRKTRKPVTEPLESGHPAQSLSL
jgi:hypothetical protein